MANEQKDKEAKKQKHKYGFRVALFSAMGVNLKKDGNKMSVKFIITHLPKEIKDDDVFGYIVFCQLKPNSQDLTDNHGEECHMTKKWIKRGEIIEVKIIHIGNKMCMAVNGSLKMVKTFAFDETQSFGFWVSFQKEEYCHDCPLKIVKQKKVDFKLIS